MDACARQLRDGICQVAPPHSDPPVSSWRHSALIRGFVAPPIDATIFEGFGNGIAHKPRSSQCINGRDASGVTGPHLGKHGIGSP